jgi:hypothetical protein
MADRFKFYFSSSVQGDFERILKEVVKAEDNHDKHIRIAHLWARVWT